MTQIQLVNTRKIIATTLALVSLGLFAYLLSGFLHPSHAQESVGTRNLTVVPPSISLSANPGDRKEGTIKLINDSDEAISVYVDTQDFIVTDPHGIPSLLPPNTYSKNYSAAAWLGVDPSTFTIGAHQRAVLTYYLQVPPEARPGGHYTALIFKPVNAGTQGQTGASVQTQIGTLFSVHVSGPLTEKANAVAFKANHFQEFGPVQITTQIQNLGDSDITPKGEITFYNFFGQKVGALFLDDHRIFPEAVREFSNTYGTRFMIGSFTAKLLASYGSNNNLPLAAQLTFIIFPWRLAIIVLLFVIAVILAYLVWNKRQQTPQAPEGMLTESAPPSTPQDPTA